MPYLTKEVISQYIGTECRRQLRLTLSPDAQAYRGERAAQQMPPPQPPRPGLEQFAQEGEKWQAAKLHDLTQTFGAAAVVGDRRTLPNGQVRYRPITLRSALRNANADQFLVEAEYEVGAVFETALDIAGYRAQFNLNYAAVRPDLIEVAPPGTFSATASPSGEVAPLAPGDSRLQLRIVDIKLTSEPSPGHFAQVVYYAMVLAGWLVDHSLDRDFVVVPDCALWPGSHEASHLVRKDREWRTRGITPTQQQLRDALRADLEPAPFEVFAFWLRRFFQEELHEVLCAPAWRDLEWHVDNRCKGCEYLGYPWLNRQGQQTDHPDHCMPTAQRQDHLSRVAFISRGARAVLESQQVKDVATLSQRPPQDSVFNVHQVLRATRTVVPARAVALQTQQPSIPARSGTSAVLPKWSDLRIYLSVDFDQSSAITFAFGLKAFWIEPRPFGANSPAPRQTQSWQARAFIVDQKDLAVEQRELLRFLDAINEILATARSKNPQTTVQCYIWDTLQYDHMTRVIGRHLQAVLNNQILQRLAWLFPPEELLPNPAMATHRSPITIVRDVVRPLLAAPVAHYYSLLELARVYHDQQLPQNVAKFSIHPLFEDALSDQIPSERAHDIWSGSSQWVSRLNTLQETVRKRLSALETVTERLQADLTASLDQTAPTIQLGPPQRQNRLSVDSQLWYAFEKLNDALEKLEVHQIWAMPPHEREARFHSARLVRRLTGPDEERALKVLKLTPERDRRVYEMRDGSQQVRLREGDFNFALAPELSPGFLDETFGRVTQGALQVPGIHDWTTMNRVTQVTVTAIDRDAGLIAVDASRRWPTVLDDLEAVGVNLSRNVVLDPVHHDYFTGKFLRALQAIGNPPNARDDPLVRRATGQLTGRGARQSATTPPADLLWDAPRMHSTPVGRVLPPVRAALARYGLSLNHSQWQAWEEALSRRLALIWGPPGTGKSRTARAIIVGAALEAHQQRRPLRILVCAATYRAMDNVLLPVHADIQAHLQGAGIEVYRLRSYLQARDPNVPPQIDVEINKTNPSSQVQALRSRLQQAQGIVVVGATPEQAHNLLVMNNQPAQSELFDLILIDEASQMDVAHAILALCALASGGSVVLAGDPKQLPPIHQAEAPLGLEHLVGSLYTFCREFHQVPDVMLTENYRSNATIVEFTRHTGYQSTLSSYSPQLRLNVLLPLPTTRPANWPAELYWTPEWPNLLDPDYPATCFVYREGRSSQWNQFEADAVAALITLLSGRLANQLLNERDPLTGTWRPATNSPYTPSEFWKRAVGVVTPHRAQQGLIVSRLQQIFTPLGVASSLIRDAVDTVERFQGQERDVMIASFALGDPDAIAHEDEFLMSLNRFNVMASRAQAKLVVLVSREVVDHLSHDLGTLRESRLLKLYVDAFCGKPRPMTLGVVENGVVRQVPGIFKRR